MTGTELNNYIKHYLEKDKTHTAIMLTGEWGSGKTYYIENELIPFLTEGKKNRCVVVSLYGIESISDISKSIYMELRIKALEKKSEAMATGKLLTKTIVKGAIGILGIDANLSEDDFRNLYESVDLSGKLLVFEDLERSHIDLINLLGYINNLVERDGVKVLLVANENEILNKEPEKFYFNFTGLFSHSKEDNENKNSESVRRYLKIKEKTISDTVYFESDYCKSVENIVTVFKNEKLDSIMDKNTIEVLAVMVKGNCHKNLRTFIFATQKTVDIFDKIEDDYGKDFLKCIYFGIVCFSAKIKEEDFPAWNGTEFLSVLLGTNQYPLFKFCYDFIRLQKINTDKIKDTSDAYNKLKLYDRKAEQYDEDLQKIYSYYERTEIEVWDALKSIEKRLMIPNDIGFYNYGKLAAYLIMISHVIEFDYTQCKERMVRNIKGKGNIIDSGLLFLSDYNLDEEEKKELDNFIEQLSVSMNDRSTLNDFSYKPEDINGLCNKVIGEKDKINSSHEFISRFDTDKLVEMLFSSSAKQISVFRDVLFAVYRYASKIDFIETNIDTMKTVIELIQKRVESQDYDIDKIQVLQLKYLCSNLKTFISQMS